MEQIRSRLIRHGTRRGDACRRPRRARARIRHGSWQLPGTTGATRYTHEGLGKGETRRYRVRAERWMRRQPGRPHRCDRDPHRPPRVLRSRGPIPDVAESGEDVPREARSQLGDGDRRVDRVLAPSGGGGALGGEPSRIKRENEGIGEPHRRLVSSDTTPARSNSANPSPTLLNSSSQAALRPEGACSTASRSVSHASSCDRLPSRAMRAWRAIQISIGVLDAPIRA